jgi:hypothetical protein
MFDFPSQKQNFNFFTMMTLLSYSRWHVMASIFKAAAAAHSVLKIEGREKPGLLTLLKKRS